jgi:methylenetetrahydrofolate--tRNA-(uracil-5-)-methyltransferase
MKPAGLTDPKTGRWPYACVQLRQETLRADSYNLVGFQNSLKYGEQARILRMIPGLENAKFLRYGQIHRNTYIHAPSLLMETLQLKAHPSVLIAGQLSGVEGYTESIAGGLLAGRFAAALARGEQPTPAPRLSANGSLVHYITFDLLVPLEEELRKKIRDKKERHRIQCERALDAWDSWLQTAVPVGV